MNEQLPRPTDVTATVRHGDTLKVWIGRTSCFLHNCAITFVGDEHPDLFAKGRTYTLRRNVPNTECGVLHFRTTDNEHNDYEELSVYAIDVEYYLRNGGFHIDDWR